MMVRLKRDYIRIYPFPIRGNASYGGSQTWLGDDPLMKRAGCGVIAFADLLRYLYGDQKRFIQDFGMLQQPVMRGKYLSYIEHVKRSLWGIPGKLGLNAMQLVFHFNRMSLRYHGRMFAYWRWNGGGIFKQIREMLQKDIPVILCIPYLPFTKKSNRLWLYQKDQKEEFRRSQQVNGHYVVVTAADQMDNDVRYTVSSWGQKYYFFESEYLQMMRKHPLSYMMGGIMIIKKI